MAGSRERFNYTTDSAEILTLTLDESNGRATVSGAGRITPDQTVPGNSKPQGFKPRYCLAFLTANPQIRRRFIVGDPAAVPNVVAPGATLTAAVYANADDTPPATAAWSVTYYSGEQRAVVPAVAAPDTGLDEGTT